MYDVAPLALAQSIEAVFAPARTTIRPDGIAHALLDDVMLKIPEAQKAPVPPEQIVCT